MKRFRFLAYVCLIVLICSCAQPENHTHVRQVISFGTTVEVTLAGVTEERANIVLAAIEAELHYMHDQWHAWRPSSITRLNQDLQTGDQFTLDADLRPLIEQSKQLYEMSLTYFNPAIGKLIELWGFYRDDPQSNKSLPDVKAIETLLIANPNMNDIELVDDTVRGLNQAIQLDFGGYAKGYGVEQLIILLQQSGIGHAMVNAGGDIKVIGQKHNRPWKVAIEDPHMKTALGWIYLNSGESIFSSGDYRRYYEIDGQRYHHIIDPETGFPTTHARGATVVADDGAIADAAATALMVAPKDDWMKLKESMGLKHILVVARDGTLYCDPQLAQRLNLLTNKTIQILEESENG